MNMVYYSFINVNILCNSGLSGRIGVYLAFSKKKIDYPKKYWTWQKFAFSLRKPPM